MSKSERNGGVGVSAWDRFIAYGITRIQSFWFLQVSGWIVFTIVTHPARIMYLGSASYSAGAAVYHCACGIVFTSVLRRIFQRMKRKSTPRWRFALLAVMLVVGAGLFDALLFIVIDGLLPHAQALHSIYGMFFSRPVIYLTWAALYFLVEEVRLSRRREIDLHAARSASFIAEIQMLRAQMDPHFLFNAFNVILAGLDKHAASMDSLILALADYFRFSLNSRGEAMVPVENEFNALLNYLVVEKARFRDSLVIESHLDEAAREFLVPGIILQPLIENALRYGFQTSPSPLNVRFLVQAPTADSLRIEVANSGYWIEPSEASPGASGGHGLSLLRRRLELIFPGAMQLEFPAPDTLGEVVMRVCLSIPHKSGCQVA